MRFIRWPIVSLLLLAILIGFFIIGHLSDTVIRQDLEYYSSEALDTIVQVGTLKLNVFHSVVRAEDVTVIDPGNKSRYAFRARRVDLRADVTRFFEKRVLLRDARIHNCYLRVHQTEKGEIDFLSDAAIEMAGYEPTIVKVRRILTWTADHVNPVKLVSTLRSTAEPARQQPSGLEDAPDEYEQTPLPVGVETQTVVRGFRLKLPRDYPDFVLKELSVANGALEIVPYNHTRGLLLHHVWGKCFGLSSLPTKHPKPITFAAKGFVGPKSNSWFNVSGRVDIFGGRTNVLVDFALSNINLMAVLPLVSPYTEYARMLNITSGRLTMRGRFQFEDGVIHPSTIYCRLDGFSGRASGVATGQKWLDSLSISDGFIEAAIPIDNTPPYFHLDTAFENENFRTTIRDFKMKFKPSDIGDDLFDGVF